MTERECPDDNRLAQLADGSLADVDRLAIERHFDGCASCSAMIAELAWVIAPPRESPPGYRLERPAGAGWIATAIAGGTRIALRFERRDPRAVAALAIARRLEHPNVRRVIDAGDHGGDLFVVEDLVDDDPPAADREPIAVWRDAIAGVAALHRAGAVHGAIAPEHVVVTAAGVRVGGIAAAPPPPASGLVAYERLHGAAPSQRADQFALCACAWEAITGARPFVGPTPGAIAVKMMIPPAPPAGRRGRHVAALIRGLSADPADRFPDLDALLRSL